MYTFNVFLYVSGVYLILFLIVITVDYLWDKL